MGGGGHVTHSVTKGDDADDEQHKRSGTTVVDVLIALARTKARLHCEHQGCAVPQLLTHRRFMAADGT